MSSLIFQQLESALESLPFIGNLALCIKTLDSISVLETYWEKKGCINLSKTVVYYSMFIIKYLYTNDNCKLLNKKIGMFEKVAQCYKAVENYFSSLQQCQICVHEALGLSPELHKLGVVAQDWKVCPWDAVVEGRSVPHHPLLTVGSNQPWLHEVVFKINKQSPDKGKREIL